MPSPKVRRGNSVDERSSQHTGYSIQYDDEPIGRVPPLVRESERSVFEPEGEQYCKRRRSSVDDGAQTFNFRNADELHVLDPLPNAPAKLQRDHISTLAQRAYSIAPLSASAFVRWRAW